MTDDKKTTERELETTIENLLFQLSNADPVEAPDIATEVERHAKLYLQETGRPYVRQMYREDTPF